MNDRKILNGFYASLGLTEKAGDIMRTVDKLEKIGAGKVQDILTGDLGLSAEQAREIVGFLSTGGSTEEILSALEQRRGRDPVFDEGTVARPGTGLLHRDRL